MTKHEFFTDTTSILKNTLNDLNEIDSDLAEVNAKIASRTYAPEHVKKVLEPMRDNIRRDIETKKENALAKIRELSESFVSELNKANDLNPADITEDAKLLSLGVTLSAKDLEKIFDRNVGNTTMERLIIDYARERNVSEFKRVHRVPYSEEIGHASAIPGSAEVVLRWYNKPDVYTKLFGEESAVYSTFTV